MTPEQRKELEDLPACVDDNGNLREDSIKEKGYKVTEIQSLWNNLKKRTVSVLEKKTKISMKRTMISTVLQNISNYMDETHADMTNFAEDFSFDGEKGVKMEDGTIEIEGKLKGQELSIKYDMKTGESFVSDTMALDIEDKSYAMNQKGKFSKLPIKIPTEKELYETARKVDCIGVL